jgi:hypothetical protein
MNSLRARGVMSFQAARAAGWRPALCAGLQEIRAPPHRALVGGSLTTVAGILAARPPRRDEAPQAMGR